MNSNEWTTLDGDKWIADGMLSAYPVELINQPSVLPATYICRYQGRLKKLVIPQGEIIYECSPTETEVTLLEKVFDFLSHLSEEDLDMINIDHVVSLMESQSSLIEELSSVTMDSVMQLLQNLEDTDQEEEEDILDLLVQ